MDSQIGQRGLKLPTDIPTAFEDGLFLIPLAEVVTEDKAMKYSKKPKFRIHKVENCSLGLRLLTDHGFVPDISPENFVDCNETLTMGFIWQLFVHWTGGDRGESKGGDDLLAWVQSHVKDNDRYPGVPIDNFTTHWQDGKVVAALLDSLSPKIYDYTSAPLDDGVALWTGALDAAEDWLDVPQLLEPEDMVDEKPDDKSVRMQVELIRQAYLAHQADIDSGALFPEDEPVAAATPAAEPDAAPAPRPRRVKKDPRDDVSRDELIDALVDMYGHINGDLLECPECHGDLTEWAADHNARVPEL